MFIHLYNILSKIAIWILSKNKRIQEGLDERYARELPVLSSSIWIQSASAGESYLVESLLHKMDEEARDFFLTTWTKQGREILLSIKEWARKNRPLWKVEVRYFPFDTLEQMQKVLNTINPRTVLFIETEIWPALLYECKKRGIPTVIVNGRMSKKSYFWYKKIQVFLKSLSPDVIVAISEKDAGYYRGIFPKAHIECINNIKFTRLQKGIEEDSTIILPQGKKIVLFASVRVKEKDIIVEFLKHVDRDIVCIIVPRHLHHVNEFSNVLSEAGIEYSVYTQNNVNTTNIIIWDKFGELQKLYMKSQIVIVGGTFYKEYGGQNFLEPLLYGIVPIVGQYRANFLWAEEGLIENNLLESVDTTEDLIKTIQNRIDNNVEDCKDKFQKWLYPKTRGVEEVFFVLQKQNIVL